MKDRIELFDIYYSDLTETAQKALCEAFETTPQEEGWEVFPLTSIQRQNEVDKASMLLEALSKKVSQTEEGPNQGNENTE